MRYLFNDNESVEDEFNSRDKNHSRDEFRHKLAQIVTVIIFMLGSIVVYMILIK